MAILSEHPSTSTLPSPLAEAAGQLVALSESATEGVEWAEVAKAGKVLADALRSEELRAAAGASGIPAAVGELAKAAVRADGGASDLLKGRTELARVVGNLCFEHDINRQLCLDVDVPTSLAALLSSVLEVFEEESTESVEQQRVLSIEELLFVRAAVGALMNMSLKFDPVRRALATRPVLLPLLAILDARTFTGKKTAPIWTVGCWASARDEDEQRLSIASMIVSWTVNVLEDVLGESKADFPPSGILSLSSPLLAILTSPSAPPPPTRALHFSGETASDFLDTDIELLSVCSAQLEGLLIDLETCKLFLAFSTFNPSLPYPASSTLEHLLAFIKSSAPPPYWLAATDDQTRTERAFSTIKAAVVRAVVEAPNSDEVMKRLWVETKTPVEDGEGERSWLVEKLVVWLEEAQEAGREDMLICAAHMLAGLGRKDEHTLSLVHDYGLAAPLARIVRERVEQSLAAPGERGRPGETTQILFGVVSLLRHLAIPVKNRQVVGETGVINAVSMLLRKELDIVGPLQLSSIGLLKHLTGTNIPNSLEVLGIPPPPTSAPSDTSIPLDNVLSLITRTNDTRLRSEASRILVNLVRSLFSTPTAPASSASTHEDPESSFVAQGRDLLVEQKEVAAALCALVRRSEKYPMLVNEGIVALALLAGGSDIGAAHVLSALVAALSSPIPPPNVDSTEVPKRSTSLALTSAGDPSSAAAMLSSWFGLVASSSLSSSSTSVRPEMVANAAALVVAVLQRTKEGVQVEEREKLRVELVGPLAGARERLEKEEETGSLRNLMEKAEELIKGK